MLRGWRGRALTHSAAQKAKGGAAQPAAPSDATQAAPVEPAVPEPTYDEALDAVTAAALADGDADYEDVEDEDDDDYGFELPALGVGEAVDMEALAALPKSMQLEFMQRHREQQGAANRERFAKASETAPAAFSAVQMETYIAGGRFKRQLNAIVHDAGGAEQTDAMRAQRIAGDTV